MTIINDYQMPSGRYEDCEVCNLPTDYLEFCSQNLLQLRAPVRRAVKEELLYRKAFFTKSKGHQERQERLAANPPIPPKSKPSKPETKSESVPVTSVETVEKAKLEKAIRTWKRHVMMKYHPDRGSSVAESQAIGYAVENLESLIHLILPVT